MEKVVAKQLLQYLTANNLIHSDQFGFRPKHETAHAVLKATKIIYNAKEQNLRCGAVLIDLKKAFDTVSHGILLDKLHHLGVNPNWFRSYLYKRPQYTEINSTKSSELFITTGVPQGSILGPLLFLVYINDLPVSNKLHNILFADDTTLMATAPTDGELIEKLNSELNNASEWFKANELTLHPSKSTFIIFHHKNPEEFNDKIILQNVKVSRTGESELEKSAKFVGIKIDENLNWNHHISYVKKKISLGAYTIATHKKLLNKKCKVMLYNAFVKSHLEYGLPLWGNGTIKQIITLQKKIIRNVSGSKNFRCHTNSLFFNLNILKFQDLRALSMAKLARRFCFSDLPAGIQNVLFSPKSNTSHNTRQSEQKNLLEIPVLKNTKLAQSFLVRVPSTWNQLNECCRTAKTNNALSAVFKKLTFKAYKEEPVCSIKNCFSCKNA